MDVDSNFTPYYLRAKVYMKTKNIDLALKDIEKALELEPNDEDILELKQECLKKIEEKIITKSHTKRLCK